MNLVKKFFLVFTAALSFFLFNSCADDIEENSGSGIRVVLPESQARSLWEKTDAKSYVVKILKESGELFAAVSSEPGKQAVFSNVPAGTYTAVVEAWNESSKNIVARGESESFKVVAGSESVVSVVLSLLEHFTLTLRKNDRDTSEDSRVLIDCTAGIPVSIPQSVFPNPYKRTLVGWSRSSPSEENQTVLYTASEPVLITEDTTLYPVWSGSYYVDSFIDFMNYVGTACDNDVVVFTGSENYDVTSAIPVSKNITLKAPDGKKVVLARNSSLGTTMFFVESGKTLTLENFIIDGTNTELSGIYGGAFNILGNLILNNCEIKGNVLHKGKGSAAYISSNASLVMNGGEIHSNDINGGNGTIYVDGGTFNFNSGTIRGNIPSGDKGAGIYCESGNICMNGSASLSEENNIYLNTQNGAKIKVTGALTSSEKIPVSLPEDISDGTTLIEADGGVDLSLAVSKFAITGLEGDNEITSDGKFAKYYTILFWNTANSSRETYRLRSGTVITPPSEGRVVTNSDLDYYLAGWSTVNNEGVADPSKKVDFETKTVTATESLTFYTIWEKHSFLAKTFNAYKINGQDGKYVEATQNSSGPPVVIVCNPDSASSPVSFKYKGTKDGNDIFQIIVGGTAVSTGTINYCESTSSSTGENTDYKGRFFFDGDSEKYLCYPATQVVEPNKSYLGYNNLYTLADLDSRYP